MLIVFSLNSLITVIVVLAIIGLVMWLIFYVIPMPPFWRRIMAAVIAIFILIWILSNFSSGTIHF